MKDHEEVSERALLQRINRALRKDDEVVKRCRETSSDYVQLGTYYSIDTRQNFVTGKHIDLAELGDKLGVRIARLRRVK